MTMLQNRNKVKEANKKKPQLIAAAFRGALTQSQEWWDCEVILSSGTNFILIPFSLIFSAIVYI